MAQLVPVDHDPFDGSGPQFVAVDHDPFAIGNPMGEVYPPQGGNAVLQQQTSSSSMRFSDVPNWRSREVSGEIPRYGRPPTDTSKSYLDFPESMNIEDRRGDSEIDRFFLKQFGYYPHQLKTMLKHPFTPLNELFPEQFKSVDHDPFAQ